MVGVLCKRLPRPVVLTALAIGFVGAASAADARRIEVGAGLPLKTPSAAAAIARPGDTIIIEPGRYFDCAVWKANNLTIAGAGPGVILTDKPCEEKALFVVRGSDVTIRNITFTRCGYRTATGPASGPRVAT